MNTGPGPSLKELLRFTTFREDVDDYELHGLVVMAPEAEGIDAVEETHSEEDEP